jgi:hypothetical protein
MASCDVLSPQRKPYLISHLKLMWYPMFDHGVSCTWNWISREYHELVVGCAGFTQKIWFLDQPQSEHGRTLPMKLQWVELCQWGPMAGTPSTPENDCGQ